MTTPFVSIRRHIQRFPGEAIEPTSTLVLSSHTCHFVDIRIFVETLGNGTKEPLPTENGPMSRLDWAFAGVSTTTKAISPNGPVHTVWSHWIDSQSSDPETDEGDMYEQDDGDTLECGQNVDVENGEIKKYEELWGNVSILPVESVQEHICVVLKAEGTASNTKAMIIRVGDWCQGISKVGEDVTVERWQWSRGWGWDRIARLGDQSLACEATFDTAYLKEGNVFKHRGLEWKVVELFRWA
ncbi:hypothetical protein MMC13_005652 [Lambiella insularis]|nr:hypothetical protein [Lambiella insularis]